MEDENEIWILQFCVNDYNQEGFYSTRVWIGKPTLAKLAGKPLEQLSEEEIINIVKLYNGEEVNEQRLVKAENGEIPL